jgi:hypothetical protein
MGELFHRFIDFIPTRLRDMEKLAAEMEVQIGFAIHRRRAYLLAELDFWLEAETDLETWEVLCRPMFFKITDELVKLRLDVYWKNKPGKGDVTEDMKRCAKDYPINKLIDFSKGRRVKCIDPNHEDKAPSLGYYAKGNSAKCFGCNRRFDSVDVLMVRDGMSYLDAVRQLCVR